jgi:hypothetical protein
MSRDEALALLRHQRARGPLPSSADGLSAWLSALEKRFPAARIPVPAEAVSPLRALGIVVDETDAGPLALFPSDGDALDRVLLLCGLAPISGGGAASLLAALEKREDAPPPLSLPLRIQPAKASSLGWSAELFSLTVLVSNAALRKDDGVLLPRTPGPVVAVCAEYDRPLTSLQPPAVADYVLQGARAHGVPMLKLKSGWLSAPLRLEATSRLARAASGRPEALARASRFFDQLDEAWQRRAGPALQLSWPVYRRDQGGPLLDAVGGRPLPELELR